MDDRVRAEYEKILTAAIIKNGSLVRPGNTYYGWGDYAGDYDSRDPWGGGPRHSATCGIASTGRVDEDATWQEFMGTFYEGDESKHGMEVHGVTCNCGKLQDRTFRWDAPVGEAIRVVMMELLERSIKDGQEAT